MGIIAPTSAPERSRHLLDDMIYDLIGNVYLKPTNLFDNSTFTRINLAGDPEGLTVGMPEEPEGHFVYLSEVNAGRNTLAAQNTAPIDIDAATYTFNSVQVTGHAPRTPLFSAPIAPPPMPTAELVATTRLGFRIGTYQAMFTWIDSRNRHTPLSPAFPVSVTVKGQYLVFTLPNDIPEQARKIGLWLSKPNKGVGTARLQAVVDVGDAQEETYTLEQYKNGRTMPNSNQTAPASPRRPTLVRSRGLTPSVAGTYSAEVAFVHEDGSESARSPISEEVTISAGQAANNVHLSIQYGDDAQKVTERRGTYRRKDKKRQPKRDPHGRYRIYITADFGSEENKKEYVLENQTKEGGSARPFLRGEPTEFSGRTKEEGRPGEQRVLTLLKTASLPPPEAGAVRTITPKDDGLEKPDAPLERVVAVTITKLTPGTYWYAISYWARDDETVPCTPQKITVPAGQTILLHFPDPVNALKNSQFTDLDADDIPYGWTLTGVAGNPNSGTYSIDDGVMTLNTLGPKNVTTQTAPQLLTTFNVDRTATYAVGGTINVLINTGQAVVTLQELNSAGTPVATTTLKSITESGEVDFEKVYGPGGQAFQDSTDRANFYVYFDKVGAGTTRDGVMAINELYVAPHTNRIRRREEPDELRVATNPDPPPHVRWKKFKNKGVEPAPRRQRRPPATFVPLDLADFGEGTPTFPSGWSQKTPIASTVMEMRTASAIDPASTTSYGYHISKSTASTAYLYLYRQYTTGDRATLGARAKYRITVIPHRGRVTIMQIKHAVGDGTTNSLGRLEVDYLGNIWLVTRLAQNSKEISDRIASGIVANDELDLELIVLNAGTNTGEAFVALGRNGSTRTYVFSRGSLAMTGLQARVVQIGPSAYTDPSSQFNLDIDTIRITNSGDTLTDVLKTPSLEPLPQPDRPLDDPVYIEEQGWETGTIDAPWSVARTPADATTTVAIQTSSAITGTQGLRCIDTGTAVTATAAVERTVTARADVGFRFRVKPSVLPTVGSLRIASLKDASDNVLGYVYLSATSSTTSDMWVAGVGVSTSPAPVKVASLIQANTIVTVEVVARGAGTSAGSIEAWVSKDGTGARLERNLMGQPQPLDWTGRQIGKLRLGIFGESQASLSANLSFDQIAITESGEMVFIETTEDGTEIYQVYVFYPQGQPTRDDLFLRGLRLAVVPGETYTASIWARHAGLADTAYPFFFTAYDLNGTPYPLGSLYGPDGATGTSGWAPRTQQFVIPKKDAPKPGGGVYEADCYEIRMESLDISSGEFCCQMLVFSPGEDATSDITYAANGSVWAVLDTETPLPPPEPLANTSAFKNIWLKFNTIVETPAGTSAIIEYGSSNELIEPSVWFTDSSDVPPRRYAHGRVTMTSDVTGTLTPTLRTGSPYVEYITALEGVMMPKLLREDGTEFPSGVWVGGVMFPRGISEYDLRAPKGRTRAHRRTEPIMRIPGFTIRCHSELALAEIEETCLEESFVIEIHGRRFKFNFTEQLEFSFVEPDPGFVLNPDDGFFYSVMEATCEEIEVLEVSEITPLVTS